MKIIANIALGLLAFAGVGIVEFAVIAAWTMAGKRDGKRGRRTGKKFTADD